MLKRKTWLLVSTMIRIASAQNLISTSTVTSSTPLQGVNSVDYPLKNVNDQVVSYIPDPSNEAQYVFATSFSSATPVFINFEFSGAKTINTIYIAFSETDTVRNMQVSVDTQLCWQNTPTGIPLPQFITCSGLVGNNLILSNSGSDQYSGISVTEVMAYEDILITPISAVASSTYAIGPDISTTFSREAALTTADRTKCFSTADGEVNPTATYMLPSVLAISQLVFIKLPLPTGSTNDFSSNTNFKVGNTNCNSFFSDPLIPCYQLSGDQVIITRWTTFAVCQIGIMVSASTCNCLNTLYDATSLGTNFVNPASLVTASSSGTITSSTYTIGSTPLVITIYDISLLTNSVAVKCGISCGLNKLVLYDYDQNSEIDLTSAAINYNEFARLLTFDTTDPSFAGTHNYAIKVKIDGISGYFPQYTDFIVTAQYYCQLDSDLSGIQLYYSLDVPMSGSTPPYGSPYYYAYYNLDGTNIVPISIPYLVDNLPSCIGFDISKTTYRATVTTELGSEFTVEQDYQKFTDCMALVNGIETCGYLDVINQQLYFNFQDELFVGTNTYTIYSTAVGTKANGNPLTWTQISGQNTITVRSCATALFENPVLTSTYFDVSMQPEIQTALNDNGIVSVNAQSDMTLLDIDYCGELTVIVNATLYANTKQADAEQLLMCTPSCLKATLTSNGAFDLSISITESSYEGSVLVYGVYVQYTMLTLPSVQQLRNSTLPLQKFTLVLNTTNTQPCTLTDLQGSRIYNASLAPFGLLNSVVTEQATYAENNKWRKGYLKNQPTCVGFDSSLTTFTATFTLQNGDVIIPYTVWSDFQTCKTQPVTSCFWFDQLSNTEVEYYFYLFDESYVGQNTLTITAQFHAMIGGVMQTATDNEVIPFTIKSCGQTQITSLLEQHNDFAQKFDDQSTVDIQLNNQLKYTQYFVSDEQFDQVGGNPCYFRIFTLTIHPTETNPLATTLLDCSLSCLKVVLVTGTSDNWHRTFSTQLFINETQYVGMSFKYRLTFTYDQFANLSPTPFTDQPFKQIDFNVVIADDPTCWKPSNLDGMELLNTTGLTVTGQIIYFVAFAQYQSSVITISNLPTCDGFQTPVFAVTIANQNGGSLAVQNDFTVFTQCLLDQLTSCFHVDITNPSQLTFNYYVNDYLWDGSNQITITTTLKGTNQLGYLTVNAYTPWVFDFIVQNCRSTSFIQPSLNQILSVLGRSGTSVLEIQDTTSMSTDDPMFCGQRIVSITSSDTLGLWMLDSSCGKTCLKMTQDQQYVNLDVLVMDTNYQSQTIYFTMTVLLKQFYNTGLQQPILEFQFSVYTFPAICDSIVPIYTPNEVTKYYYRTGYKMMPLLYQIEFNPPCNQNGNLTVKINGTIVDDPLTYGLYIETVSNLTQVVVALKSSYSKNDLDELVLPIELVWRMIGVDYSFYTIYALYYSKAIQPPHFVSELQPAAVIACEKQTWSYLFPQAQDAQNLPITHNWQCKLQALKFEISGLSLDPGVPLTNGFYNCTVILSNPISTLNVYTLLITVNCSKSELIIYNKQSTPPEPKIESVDRDGIIIIAWSSQMIQTNLSNAVGEGTVQYESRNLKQDDIIRVVYSQYSDPQTIKPLKLQYTYEMYWINLQTTALKLTFIDPEFVSADIYYQDGLEVFFVDRDMFLNRYGYPVKVNSSVRITMPKQRTPRSYTINQSQLYKSGLILFGTSFVLSFILSAIINQLLKFISNLSFIIHFFIVTLNYPANVQDFFAALFPLVIFDILPTQSIYELIFGFKGIDDGPLSYQISQVGYSQTVTVANLGSFYLVTVFTLSLTLLLTLFNCFIQKCCFRFISTRITKYLQHFYWNGLIRLIDQNYLFLCFCSMIQLTNLRLDTSIHTVSEVYNSVLGILIFALLALYPVVIVILYYCKLKTVYPLPDLDDRMQLEQLRSVYGTLDIAKVQQAYTVSQHKLFVAKYGCLLEEVDIQKIGKTQAIITAILPSVRSLLFSGCIMLTINKPFICIICLNVIILATSCILLHIKPYFDQRARVFDCWVLLGVNYHLYCFTDWLSIDQQINVGNYVICFVSAQSFVVLMVSLFPICRQAKMKCRRCRQKRRLKNKKKAIHIQVESSVTDKTAVDISKVQIEQKEPDQEDDYKLQKINQLQMEHERMQSKRQARNMRLVQAEYNRLQQKRQERQNQLRNLEAQQQRATVLLELAGIESVGSLENQD